MPASKPIPREADGTVDIKQARKRMRGHRTDAEIEEKAKREVRAKEPKRIQVPKYLPQGMADEYRQTAKKLVALHIFSDLDYDMLARYFIARAAWQNAQNWANRAIMQGDAKEAGSWTKTANVYFGQCQSCAAALGLSVSARCRLVMPEPPKDEADEDPLSRMLRERAERRKAWFVRGCDGQCNACSSFDLWRQVSFVIFPRLSVRASDEDRRTKCRNGRSAR